MMLMIPSNVMTELAIIKQDNIQEIIQCAPQSYADNNLSRTRCEDAGLALLASIQTQGMTDELDQQAAAYIEKARNTVKKMNERRSPVTKLFDEIRKEFTTMEAAIDPTKQNSTPWKLQQLRNQYAAQKRAEEEERMREAVRRQQVEQARRELRQNIEQDIRTQVKQLINRKLNELSQLDHSVTLGNYDSVLNTVENFDTSLPENYVTSLQTLIRIPEGISVEELRFVETSVKEQLSHTLTESYQTELQQSKQYILDRLPSKKANLERIAQANAEEAARLQAEIAERARKEAEAQEAERKRKEVEEAQRAELERQQVEMQGFFDNAATVQSYQPKVKVDKRIEVLNPEGFMPLLSMWWLHEGCKLTVEELSKMFKKQITFCENLAKKQETYIQDENICYVDVVKAR